MYSDHITENPTIRNIIETEQSLLSISPPGTCSDFFPKLTVADEKWDWG